MKELDWTPIVVGAKLDSDFQLRRFAQDETNRCYFLHLHLSIYFKDVGKIEVSQNQRSAAQNDLAEALKRGLEHPLFNNPEEFIKAIPSSPLLP